MNSSFLNSIKYKRKRVGVIEKDGKTYIKYVKERRLKFSKNIKYVLLVLFVLGVLGVGLKMLMLELSTRPLADDAIPEGIGG